MREEFLGRISLPKITSLAAAILFLGTGVGEANQHAPQTIDFSRDIYPIFERSCHSCHGPALQQGKLRLDSRQEVLSGGQSGSIIQPGDAAESTLYQRVAGLNDLVRMPMGGELASDEIELIRTWIEEGAEWPEKVGLVEGETGEQHWAFVAPKRPSLPRVRKQGWLANALDHFILARLEQANLSPSPEAKKVTLLRRLSLDLVGLPPSIEEVETFLADQRPDALPATSGETPGVATLWRALGQALAGCGPIRRLRRIRKGQAAKGLVLPGLGHQRPQPRSAL